MDNLSGFTCETCGKVFESEEEFENRHNERYTKLNQPKSKKNVDL
jgi:hypothetical protein